MVWTCAEEGFSGITGQVKDGAVGQEGKRKTTERDSWR